MKLPFLPPFDFKKWIEENRDLLKPPVGNKVIWQNQDFIAMVVGGPNARTDYHVDESEEIFYQLEGNMVLKLFVDGKIQDLPIRAGEIFLLPSRVPHSPRRPAASVGLVIERKRQPGELDGFQWYCETCEIKIYEEFAQVTNIEKDMPPIFQRFYDNPKNSTCPQCQVRVLPPKKS